MENQPRRYRPEFMTWVAIVIIVVVILTVILHILYILLYLVMMLVSAFVAGWIGRDRRIGFVTAFLIGLVLPVVGIAAALLSERVDD